VSVCVGRSYRRFVSVLRNPTFQQFVRRVHHDVVIDREPVLGEVQMENIIVQKTTTFHDEGDVHRENIVEHIPTTILNPAPDVDLMNFLARPIVVYTSTWSSALAIGDTITDSLIFPNILLSRGLNSVKLSKIYMYRPDIEISVRINCTPMHFGRIMLAVYPIPEILPATYRNWRNASGAEWYQISANKEQTVVFVVPYRNTLDWLDLTGPSSEMIKSLFQVRPYVAVPLSMTDLTADTATSVSVQFYARFITPRLCGYTSANVAQADNFEASSQEEINQTASRQTTTSGMISRPLKILGDFITIFRRVPVIGAFIAPIGQGFRFSADILKTFGFSTPVNNAITQPITFKTTHYNACDDTPNSVKLGSAQDMSLSKDFEMVYDSPDCMNVLKMCQRPFLVYTGKISSSTTVGQNLYIMYLAPQNMVNLSYANPTIDDAAFYPSTMAYLATRLGMWRGGFRVCISFIASAFHSMRIRAVWEPSNVVVAGGAVYDTQDMFNIVMDINDHHDYTFTIPYMKDTHWCYTQVADTTADHEITNGTLCLQAMTTLTSASAVVNPIYYQVFVSAAADFQFAVPTNEQLQYRGFAQMDNIAPSTSHIECMRSVYPPIGGIPEGVVTFNRNTSYVINSIRQLITPLTMAYALPNSDTTYPTFMQNGAGVTMKISPYAIYKFVQQTSNNYGSMAYVGNHFLAMRLLFAFHRGATRVSVISDIVDDSSRCVGSFETGHRGSSVKTAVGLNGIKLQATIQYPGTVDNIPPIVAFDASGQVTSSSVFDYTTATPYNFATGHSFASVMNKNQLDVTLPYFSVYNCRHLSFNGVVSMNDGETVEINGPAYRVSEYYEVAENASGTAQEYPITTYMSLTRGGGADGYRNWNMMTPVKYRIYIAAGDDYIMGVQLPVPKCARTTPVVTRVARGVKFDHEDIEATKEIIQDRAKRAIFAPSIQEILDDLTEQENEIP